MRWMTWRAVWAGGPCEREGKGEGFDFAAVKPTTPFGQLPLLYIDGDEAGLKAYDCSQCTHQLYWQANPMAQCTRLLLTARP